MNNNQKEKLFSNKYIQKFLDDKSKVNFNDKDKFDEISSSLAFYLKSFSNINKFLDYICLIFKHFFNEKIILIIPLNYQGEIWHENIKISSKNDFLKIQKEINFFLNKFHFSKNFKIKEISNFENSLKDYFKEYTIETQKYYLEASAEDLFISLVKTYQASLYLKILTLILFKIV